MKAHVSLAETFKGCAIGADHIRAEHFRGCHQPGVVLAHAAGGAALQQRTAARVRKMQALNGKPLQRCYSGTFIHRALEQLLDGHN